MSEYDLRVYISSLKIRASNLGTLPRKSVQKEVEVAEKIYNFNYPSDSDAA